MLQFYFLENPNSANSIRSDNFSERFPDGFPLEGSRFVSPTVPPTRPWRRQKKDIENDHDSCFTSREP